METAVPATSAYVALILDANGTFTPICETAARHDEHAQCTARLTSEERRRQALLGCLTGAPSSPVVRIPLPRPVHDIPEAARPLMRAVSDRLAEKDATAAAVGRALIELYHVLGSATRLH
jgi:hypothetical protein